MPFIDRVDAGRRLAEVLAPLEAEDVVVLGLPRGGVVVAAEVARALHAPLDVIVVRKLGVPFQPELGMGAIGEGGVRLLNHQLIQAARVSDVDVARVEAAERTELERRARRYRGDRERLDLSGRVAVVVDDGIATGFTARAACEVARTLGARRVVLAAPVGPRQAIAELGAVADDVVFVESPPYFDAIGRWYEDFSQTTDDEVIDLLRPEVTDRDVTVFAGPVALAGRLTIPADARGLVVFAHGSGSSRHSPRNQFVAAVLQEAGLATLLFDLLTPAEERDRSNVFDIPLLAGRLADATRWLAGQAETGNLSVGYFGASTGAGAALWAAAEPDLDIRAVVSRGGRPDLAGPRLGEVRAPTLLIVGGRDEVVLDLNRQALAAIRAPSRLEVVPGATHLFEEPGTLAAAAGLARDWFVDHLSAVRR